MSSKLIDLTRSNITLIYSNLLLVSGTCFIVAISFVFAIKVTMARKTRKRQQKLTSPKLIKRNLFLLRKNPDNQTDLIFLKIISSKYTTHARKLLLCNHNFKALLIAVYV